MKEKRYLEISLGGPQLIPALEKFEHFKYLLFERPRCDWFSEKDDTLEQTKDLAIDLLSYLFS